MALLVDFDKFKDCHDGPTGCKHHYHTNEKGGKTCCHCGTEVGNCGPHRPGLSTMGPNGGIMVRPRGENV